MWIEVECVIFRPKLLKIGLSGQVQWLIPIILATQEAEIGRIVVQGQPRQKVHKAPSHPIKAGHGATCLSSHLCRKYK
jgi:hypothetical protein